jgi:hypothetical protein
VFWVVKWWLGALGMREERRGWEGGGGLYGVRGNEVEKEEGDLKRSRGGSESSVLDRTRAEPCGARAECTVGVLCGSMRASIHERNPAHAIKLTDLRSIASCRKSKQKEPK